jgi:hypothetical protein
MKIRFERSGGFAGLTFDDTIDLNKLSADDASNIRQLVNNSGLLSMPQSLASFRSGPDRFQYVITIEDQETTHTVKLDEEAVPPSMKPLLQRLTSIVLKR